MFSWCGKLQISYLSGSVYFWNMFKNGIGPLPLSNTKNLVVLTYIYDENSRIKEKSKFVTTSAYKFYDVLQCLQK